MKSLKDPIESNTTKPVCPYSLEFTTRKENIQTDENYYKALLTGFESDETSREIRLYNFKSDLLNRQAEFLKELSKLRGKNNDKVFKISKCPHKKRPSHLSEDNPSHGNIISNRSEPSPSRVFRKYKNKISAKRSRLNKKIKFRQAELENLYLKKELIKLNSIYNSEFLRQLNIMGFKDKQICQKNDEDKKEFNQALIDVKNIDLLFCRLVKILMPIEVQLLSRNYCNSNQVLSLDDLKNTLIMHKHMFESMNKNTHLSTNVRVYQILEMFDYLFSIISSAQRVLDISQSKA